VPYKPANLAEIDNKLREDFRRRLVEAGYQQADVNDPVLRILFRSFASQLEALYAAPGHVREAFLDELISGLGFEPRMARPAQTVVRFYTGDCVGIRAGSHLVGETPAGEKLIFTTDETITVSGARIAFAAAYWDGALQLAAGMHLPDELLSAQPNYDPVPAPVGPAPCLYIVVENLPESHLGGHSFFFDISSAFPQVQRALLRATWCLASADGRFEAAGVLRPRRANAGVRMLEWLRGISGEANAAYAERPALPDGFYAGKVVVFPDVPPASRVLCPAPGPLDASLARLFRGHGANWKTPRAWIRILLPEGLPNLHNAIQSIALHAISASNVLDFNETIVFERQGTSIPVSREAGTTHFLVAPLSVTGEDNTPYISEYQSSPDPGTGRYAVRNGRIDLTPARHADGATDSIMTLRTWVTSGALGNTVPAGKVQTFLKPDDSSALRMNNPMPAAGGSDGEPIESAQARFGRALLSRDRIVTKADLDCAVRAFDERIVDVASHAALEPSPGGLVRVQRVVLSLDPERFQDPEEERRVLRDEIERWLRARSLYDVHIVVHCEWAAERTKA
jgi:hypothetical protein